MKISIASDLHLFNTFPEISNPGSDILILAGDNTTIPDLEYDMEYLEYLKSQWNTILYVLGNHEFYTGIFPDAYSSYREKLGSIGITLLQDEFIDISGYRFIGSTLWTDYNNIINTFKAYNALADFRYINTRMGRVTPNDFIESYKKSVEFIKNSLVKNSIVITHHAPSPKSIVEKFKDSPVNSAFYSNLEYLITDDILLWVHGHTHSKLDYFIENSRIICNPRGYRHEETYIDFELCTIEL